MTPDTRYRVRLPNKTAWALDDILADARRTRALLSEILVWTAHEADDARLIFDKPRQARLAQLNHIVARLALAVAGLERTAVDARHGEYNGETDLSLKGIHHAAPIP